MADEKNKEMLDDFWDIDALIPAKKEVKNTKAVSNDAKPAEISLDAPQTKEGRVYTSEPISPTEIKRFIPPFTAEDEENRPKPEREYIRENSLIRKVSIYAPQTKYRFYERFTDDAKALLNKKGEECPLVPFFSFSPQYNQLNRAQLAYYLWWRENLRNGVFLDADYSYILLYLYELINLSDTLEPSYCLDQFCTVWLNYGEKHKFIGRYLSEWVCDLCLLYDLPVPAERIRRLYPQIMQDCTLKEFYALCEGGGNMVCAQTLMDVAGAYDYRKSKCATPERLPIMEKHLTGALRKVLKNFARSEKAFAMMGSADNHATRNTFTGALCVGNIRRRIEVEYFSFSHSYELKYLVSDILKYSENKLRTAFKVKSKLSIYALPTEMKKCIDEYFEAVVFTPESRGAFGAVENRSREQLEYEKLYIPKAKPLSIEQAQKIEDSSWDVTKLLVETFEEENQVETNSRELQNTEQSSDIKTALGDRWSFVKAVLLGDIKRQRTECARLCIMSDALVDEINEIAADVLGDILIEDTGDGYEIIEEYKNVIGDCNE